jgi:hypothetical protein
MKALVYSRPSTRPVDTVTTPMLLKTVTSGKTLKKFNELTDNDSDFGLGGSVFTKDKERGRRLASQIETGMMFINNIDWSDAELPFGGVKNSGYGRQLGDMGIQEFVNKKLIMKIGSVAKLRAWFWTSARKRATRP